MRKISLIFLLLASLTACSGAGSQTYDFATFTFNYPGNWKTMAELSPSYQRSE